MAAALVTLEKSAKGGMQKFFKYVPAVVLCYLIAMFLCTLGVWDMAETKPAYSALKNNLTYAMIFAMLLRCNIRKVLKLGPKMLIGFFSATLTIMIGFVCAFVLMKGTIGSDVWMGLCALCGSWIGGSGNMAAMQDALPVDPGAYACALTLDTVCYSVWIALLIFMVRYSSKWDKSVKADTSKLSAIADVANEEVEKEKKAKATSGDWVWMIGLALIVSALSQWVGAKMGAGFAGMGLKMFDTAGSTPTQATASPPCAPGTRHAAGSTSAISTPTAWWQTMRFRRRLPFQSSPGAPTLMTIRSARSKQRNADSATANLNAARKFFSARSFPSDPKQRKEA